MERETLLEIPPDVPVATTLRSSAICAVVGWLRANGLFDDYAKRLAPSELQKLLALTPSQWIPIADAMAHYRALDQSNLSDEDRKTIGNSMGLQVHRNVLDITARLARGAGLTPWVMIPSIPRLYDMTWKGGAIGIDKTGPRSLQALWVGQPAANVRHFRLAFCGYVEGVIGLFAKNVRASEINFAENEVEIEVTWVA